MAGSSTSSAAVPNGPGGRKVSSNLSPQGTGFSQIQARNIGEGSGGQIMSILLSWHEKLVDSVGVGGIIRVMSDRRTV